MGLNRGVEHADRRDTNRRAAAIVFISDSSRIVRLMKIPQGRDTFMHALPAREHFAPDRGVANVAILKDGARHRERAFGVVGRFTDQPLMTDVPGVTRDDGARRPFQAAHALRIPAQHGATRQSLRLLSDGVAKGDSLQRREDAFVDHRGGP